MSADPKAGVRFFTPLLKKYLPQLGIAGVLATLSAGLTVALPLLTGEAAFVLLKPEGGGFTTIALGLLALLSFRLLIQVSRHLVQSRIQYQFSHDSKEMLHEHLITLPMWFHTEEEHGSLVSMLNYDASVITGFLSRSPIQALETTLTLLGAGAAFLIIDPIMGAFIFITAPIAYLIARLAGSKTRTYSRRYWSAVAAGFVTADENLKLTYLNKAFSREDEAQSRYQRKSEEALRLGLLFERWQAITGPATQFVLFSGMVLMAILASEGTLGTQLETKSLVTLLLLGLALTAPLRGIAELYNSYQQALGAASRIAKATLLESEDLESGESAAILGGIRFEHVDFGYSSREQVLKDVSFHISAGEMVGFIGVNGSGKTTITHLISRIYEPSSGVISFDGHHTKDINLRHLRRHVAVVPQHTMLSNGTIRSNIIFGAPDLDEDAVQKAVHLADLDDFVSSLPEGLDTVIGDDGGRLSGGQRQRIALARAIASEAGILILDEATSMFDPESEERLLGRWAENPESKTIILITHRHSLLKLVDQVFHVRDGHVESELSDES